MAVGVQLNAAFVVGTTVYNASMALPSTDPSATAPFLFSVTAQPESGTGTAASLLTLAVGGSGMIYVAVAPPADLIAEAAGSGLVKELDVVVSEGTYDPDKHQFTPPAA